jgi:hypothetical protein
MVFSKTVISISGWFRLARLAALMPAASAPITTNFMAFSFTLIFSPLTDI